MFKYLPCEFNVQLSDNTKTNCSDVAMIVHWNSPRKLNVRLKLAVPFRDLYNIGLHMDGYALRSRDQLTHWDTCPEYVSPDDQDIQAEPVDQSFKDHCPEFVQSMATCWRKQPFWLRSGNSGSSTSKVTLITQFSVDRVAAFVALLQQWPGPISATLYVDDKEAAEVYPSQC